MIAVLDTAGVDALAGADSRARARLRRIRQDATDLLVPAGVLAEGLYTGHPGHDYHVRQFLRDVHVVSIDETLGLAAGVLRQQALLHGVAASGVDAIVAAVADACASTTSVRLLTSDDDDLEMLASFGLHSERVSIQHV